MRRSNNLGVSPPPGEELDELAGHAKFLAEDVEQTADSVVQPHVHDELKDFEWVFLLGLLMFFAQGWHRCLGKTGLAQRQICHDGANVSQRAQHSISAIRFLLVSRRRTEILQVRRAGRAVLGVEKSAR